LGQVTLGRRVVGAPPTRAGCEQEPDREQYDLRCPAHARRDELLGLVCVRHDILGECVERKPRPAREQVCSSGPGQAGSDVASREESAMVEKA
jgi:hypothetical protein